MNTNKSRVYLVLFILVFVVGAFYFYDKKESQTLSKNIQDKVTQVVVEKRVLPDGMLEYRNTTYSFSLLYPESLKVSELAEREGAITITFQNVAEQKGFQIFIIPYFEAQVSPALILELPHKLA